MSMAIGSAMKEDLERERNRRNSGPLAIGSAMKEDLEREQERKKDGSMLHPGIDKDSKKKCES